MVGVSLFKVQSYNALNFENGKLLERVLVSMGILILVMEICCQVDGALQQGVVGQLVLNL